MLAVVPVDDELEELLEEELLDDVVIARSIC